MGAKVRPKLRKVVNDLPQECGVYLMKDRRSGVIYVGKAKDLRARVRSYFQESPRDERIITRKLAEVADIAVVVTGSEKEALILESNFIKQFRPKYNVLFKDDKSFASIKISTKEPWPRPIVTRNLDDESALYFGPFASAKAARRTVRLLQDIFPLRRCSLRECRQRSRPCIYGEMGKCMAPCCRDVSQEEYRRLVGEVSMFLRGDARKLLQGFRRRMLAASESLDFEKAAQIRDKIEAVEQTLERQRVGSSSKQKDQDIFGLYAFERHVCVAVLIVRGGNVQDVASYRFAGELDSEEAIFGSFLNQFYRASRFIPGEVLLPVQTGDAEILAEWLSEKKGRKVRVLCPKRGEKVRLVELANSNARQAERAATGREEKRRREMESLQGLLGLATLPRTIECFDISTLSGREAVGSMVVFRDGEPDKSSYRHYRIRGGQAGGDTGMMEEVLRRRYGRVAREGGEAPELVLVDGGRGQLGVALRVLREFGFDGCDVAALAKARSYGGKQVQSERVFTPGRSQAKVLPAAGAALRLVVRVRDEAHRFAVAYHRKLRRKRAGRSPLEEIPGVGKKLAQRLIERFGGLNKIRGATAAQIAQVKGVSKGLAETVRRHLRQGNG